MAETEKPRTYAQLKAQHINAQIKALRVQIKELEKRRRSYLELEGLADVPDEASPDTSTPDAPEA